MRKSKSFFDAVVMLVAMELIEESMIVSMDRA